MPGLLRGMARTAVVAGTATAVSNRVSRRQAGRWAQQDVYQSATPTEPPAPVAPVAPTSSVSDKIEQLKELGALRDQGILTDSEFAAQKERLLNS
ncbi:serine kinase of HPr protein (carbohydrate metabolism regulator) [Streptacidiphilus sp. MAP12-20]|uniref:SHOCT domain-containing protein n=1 Tax=Streptacidiphilus sp. MAP12-20 TaxID=3156299 RepID=UPI0035140E9E